MDIIQIDKEILLKLPNEYRLQILSCILLYNNNNISITKYELEALIYSIILSTKIKVVFLRKQMKVLIKGLFKLDIIIKILYQN